MCQTIPAAVTDAFALLLFQMLTSENKLVTKEPKECAVCRDFNQGQTQKKKKCKRAASHERARVHAIQYTIFKFFSGDFFF